MFTTLDDRTNSCRSFFFFFFNLQKYPECLRRVSCNTHYIIILLHPEEKRMFLADPESCQKNQRFDKAMDFKNDNCLRCDVLMCVCVYACSSLILQKQILYPKFCFIILNWVYFVYLSTSLPHLYLCPLGRVLPQQQPCHLICAQLLTMARICDFTYTVPQLNNVQFQGQNYPVLHSFFLKIQFILQMVYENLHLYRPL